MLLFFSGITVIRCLLSTVWQQFVQCSGCLQGKIKSIGFITLFYVSIIIGICKINISTYTVKERVLCRVNTLYVLYTEIYKTKCASPYWYHWSYKKFFISIHKYFHSINILTKTSFVNPLSITTHLYIVVGPH